MSSVNLIQKKEFYCEFEGAGAKERTDACEESVNKCIDEFAKGEKKSVSPEVWDTMRSCFSAAGHKAKRMQLSEKPSTEKAKGKEKSNEKKASTETKSTSNVSKKAGFVCEDGSFYPLSDVSKMPKSCFDASMDALVGAPAKQGSKKADEKRGAEKKAEPKVVDMTGDKFKGFHPAKGCVKQINSQDLAKNAAAMNARKAMVTDACGKGDGKINGGAGANQITGQGVEVCDEGGFRYWVEVSGGKVTCPAE